MAAPSVASGLQGQWWTHQAEAGPMQPTGRRLEQIVRGEMVHLFQLGLQLIRGQAMAEHQGETFRQLGTGLASHGVLAAIFRLGQRQGFG